MFKFFVKKSLAFIFFVFFFTCNYLFAQTKPQQLLFDSPAILHLEPGESASLSFYLSRKDLAFFKKDMSYEAEPGEFELFVGGTSDVKERVRFVLEGK